MKQPKRKPQKVENLWKEKASDERVDESEFERFEDLTRRLVKVPARKGVPIDETGDEPDNSAR